MCLIVTNMARQSGLGCQNTLRSVTLSTGAAKTILGISI